MIVCKGSLLFHEVTHSWVGTHGSFDTIWDGASLWGVLGVVEVGLDMVHWDLDAP